jgi:hypothetical protein
MSDIKIIKVANTGGAKVDSSGFFIKPKQQEPSQLSQFIQRENEKDKGREDYDEDEDSVDSMTVSDVSSATNKSDEEYTNESMTPAPYSHAQAPAQAHAPAQAPTPRMNSIVKDETLNSYLEKPKVEQPLTESLNINSPVSNTTPVSPVSPAQVNNTNTNGNGNEQGNNNNSQSTTAQPAIRNDYYSDTEEDVIDMTDNKLYDILASVLEDEDGENVSENMSKMNRNLEKVITMFEAYQQNNTKDEYLSKIGEAIENQNKILSQIVKALEKQGQPNQDTNVVVLNERKENEKNEKQNENEKNENEKNEKNKKHEKQKSSSESSSESDKGENTEDTEKNPDIKKIKVSDILKHSTSKKDTPLKHRIQIKRKT